MCVIFLAIDVRGDLVLCVVLLRSAPTPVWEDAADISTSVTITPAPVTCDA